MRGLFDRNEVSSERVTISTVTHFWSEFLLCYFPLSNHMFKIDIFNCFKLISADTDSYKDNFFSSADSNLGKQLP